MPQFNINNRKAKRDREVDLTDLFKVPSADRPSSEEPPQEETRVVFSLFRYALKEGDEHSVATATVKEMFTRFGISPLSVSVVPFPDKLFVKVQVTLVGSDASSGRFRRLSASIEPLSKSIQIDTSFEEKLKRRAEFVHSRQEKITKTVVELVAQGMDPVQAAIAAKHLA